MVRPSWSNKTVMRDNSIDARTSMHTSIKWQPLDSLFKYTPLQLITCHCFLDTGQWLGHLYPAIAFRTTFHYWFDGHDQCARRTRSLHRCQTELMSDRRLLHLHVQSGHSIDQCVQSTASVMLGGTGLANLSKELSHRALCLHLAQVTQR